MIMQISFCVSILAVMHFAVGTHGSTIRQEHRVSHPYRVCYLCSYYTPQPFCILFTVDGKVFNATSNFTEKAMPRPKAAATATPMQSGDVTADNVFQQGPSDALVLKALTVPLPIARWGAVVLISAALVVVFIITVQYARILHQRFAGRLPNGPFPLPVVGTIGIDHEKPFCTFEKFAKTYGGIFSCYLGSDLTVVIADVHLLKKAFRDIRFAGRPKVTDHYLGVKVENGPVLSEGNIWKEQRHFSIQALREFGFGKRIVEDYISTEVGNCLNELRNANGNPINNSTYFANAFGNIISYLLFSSDFKSTDPRFEECAQIIAVNFQELANASTLDFYPWLRFLPPFRSGFKDTQSRFLKIFSIMDELVQQHRKTFDCDDPRDYIDAFLRVEKDDTTGIFTGEQLVRNVYDLYAAGFQSTTIFLQWAMLYMVCYPDVQKKVQDEIDERIGSQKTVTFADKIDLPYTDATIHEIFRCANFGPFLMPHKTTEKVEFEGYIIPKDTTVFGLSWYCMRDPNLWENPEVFRPERLMDENGKVDHSKTENILPFSVGKRACPGEGLARHEIFIFFASIMQHFTLLPEGAEKPSLEPIDGEALTPHPYLMRAIPKTAVIL